MIQLNEEQHIMINKLQAEVENLKLLQENSVRADQPPTLGKTGPPPDNTGTQTTPKDSESVGQSEEEKAADSDADSGKTA